MCTRARLDEDPQTIHARFGSSWARDVVRADRDPVGRFDDVVAPRRSCPTELMTGRGPVFPTRS